MSTATQPIDLASFQRDKSFYGELDLLVTVKSFDLQAIRKRYLASRANKSGRSGSVARRQPSPGGVVRVRLGNGACDAEVLGRMTEPRGIDAQVMRDGRLRVAIAAEHTVHWYTPTERGQLHHPWFSYLHTVQFHPEDPQRIVVSSSGYDWIGEFVLPSGEATWTWLAWENGFNRGRDPENDRDVLLTRRAEEAAAWQAKGESVLLVSDPPEAPIPTARRAAFINSVSYDPMDQEAFLATFFHEGKVYRIGRDGSSAALLEGLRNPHGGRRRGPAIMATSTASGEVVQRDATGSMHWQLTGLPGKPEVLGSAEWVQNSTVFGPLIVAVDSNRTSFVVFDPVRRLLDQIPYPADWAVQDLVAAPVSAGLEAWLHGLSAEQASGK